MPKVTTIITAGLAAAFAVSVLGLSPAFSSSLDQGKKEFTTYCASCHGLSGTGDGPVAPELNKKPIDLTAFADKAGGVFSRDKVKKMIDGREMPRAHGTPQMPVWGQWFSYQATAGGLLQEDRQAIIKEVNDRLDSLIIYIESIQK